SGSLAVSVSTWGPETVGTLALGAMRKWTSLYSRMTSLVRARCVAAELVPGSSWVPAIVISFADDGPLIGAPLCWAESIISVMPEASKAQAAIPVGTQKASR